MVGARQLESIAHILHVPAGAVEGDGIPVPSIRAILEAIEPEVRDFHWSVLELNSRARIGWEFVAALEARAGASPSGLRRTWAELRALVHSLEQLIDGVFVARREGCFEAADADEKFDFRRCDLALEIADGGPWRVHVREAALAERLRARLEAAGLRPS